MNNKNIGQNGQNLQPEGQAAKLAVIAGTITTLGDALATIAAILALEESRQEKMDKGDNKNMQKQIDYLTIQFEQLKNQVNNEKRHRREFK